MQPWQQPDDQGLILTASKYCWVPCEEGSLKSARKAVPARGCQSKAMGSEESFGRKMSPKPHDLEPSAQHCDTHCKLLLGSLSKPSQGYQKTTRLAAFQEFLARLRVFSKSCLFESHFGGNVMATGLSGHLWLLLIRPGGKMK